MGDRRQTGLFIWTALIPLLPLAVACGGESSGDAADGPIRIGAIAPLSGPSAAVGGQVRVGADLAVDRLNAQGGIECMDGAKIELEWVDTQGDASIATSEVKRLVGQDQVPAILGGEVSAATAAAVQAAVPSGTPYLNVVASDESLFEREYDSYFAMPLTGSDYAQALMEMATYISETFDDVADVAILGEDSTYGASVAEKLVPLVESSDLELVANEAYNRADRDLGPVISQIRGAQPDLVLWNGYVDDMVAGAQAMRSLDYFPLIVGSGSGLGDARWPDLVNPTFLARTGAMTTTFFSPDLQREPVQEMVDAYREQHDELPSPYHALGYQGALTLAAGLGEACSSDPADITEAMRELEIPGEETITAFDSIDFDEVGRNVGASTVTLQWQRSDEGQFGLKSVYPPEIAAGEIVQPE